MWWSSMPSSLSFAPPGSRPPSSGWDSLTASWPDQQWVESPLGLETSRRRIPNWIAICGPLISTSYSDMLFEAGKRAKVFMFRGKRSFDLPNILLMVERRRQTKSLPESRRCGPMIYLTHFLTKLERLSWIRWLVSDHDMVSTLCSLITLGFESCVDAGPTVCKSMISISMYFQSGQMALSRILISIVRSYIGVGSSRRFCRDNLVFIIGTSTVNTSWQTMNHPCLQNLY
jgi:hypothetical protein